MRTFRRALLAIFLVFAVGNLGAETVWCRKFNLGCPTEEERSKAIQNCYRLAAQSRQSAYDEVSKDPNAWRLAGARSIEDYATMRQNVMMQICLKNSPDLRSGG